MTERYTGTEACTSQDQVVRYLTENYTDAEGTPMPERVALSIVEKDVERIREGIEVFRSNVEYLGDQALGNTPGWTYLPEDEDEES